MTPSPDAARPTEDDPWLDHEFWTTYYSREKRRAILHHIRQDSLSASTPSGDVEQSVRALLTKWKCGDSPVNGKDAVEINHQWRELRPLLIMSDVAAHEAGRNAQQPIDDADVKLVLSILIANRAGGTCLTEADIAIEAFRRLTSRLPQQWRDIKTDPPPKDGTLVIFWNGKMHLARADDYHFDALYLSGTTHWLPAPPKVGEENQEDQQKQVTQEMKS